MLPVDSAFEATKKLVEAQDVRFDKPYELRERSDQVASAITMLVFAGYVDPQKGELESFMSIDAVEYYVSVAYTALINGDAERYELAVKQAESIVADAEANLKALVAKIKKAQDAKHSF